MYSVRIIRIIIGMRIYFVTVMRQELRHWNQTTSRRVDVLSFRFLLAAASSD